MKAIEIITIPVTDQQKAKEFYSKLGFELIVEAPAHEGQMWVQMALPGQSVSIALLKFNAIICETGNIEQEINELSAKGITAGKIDDTPWGRFAWVKDPDGNSVCLHQK